MANHKSTIKRMRSSALARLRNHVQAKTARNLMKKFEELIKHLNHPPTAKKGTAAAAKNEVKNTVFHTIRKSAFNKDAATAIEITADKAGATILYKNVSCLLDRLARKNVIHKNKAANKKSRLGKQLYKLNETAESLSA